MEHLQEIIKTIITVAGKSTDLLMDELIRYFAITTLLHVLLIIVVTALIYRGLKLGKMFLDNCEPSKSLTIYKLLFSVLQIMVLVGGLSYTYASSKKAIKVLAAPHVYLIEQLKALSQSNKE